MGFTFHLWFIKVELIIPISKKSADCDVTVNTEVNLPLSGIDSSVYKPVVEAEWRPKLGSSA